MVREFDAACRTLGCGLRRHAVAEGRAQRKKHTANRRIGSGQNRWMQIATTSNVRLETSEKLQKFKVDPLPQL